MIIAKLNFLSVSGIRSDSNRVYNKSKLDHVVCRHLFVDKRDRFEIKISNLLNEALNFGSSE